MTKLVKNPNIDTTTTYNAYDVQNGIKNTETPLKKTKTLYTKIEFTRLRSENHPVNSFPMMLDMAEIDRYNYIIRGHL